LEFLEKLFAPSYGYDVVMLIEEIAGSCETNALIIRLAVAVKYVLPEFVYLCLLR
jgi:hypothetical protein